MIQAIIYDKVANTNTGQMNGEIRVVGHQYALLGSEPDKKGAFPTLDTIVEEKRNDQKVLVLSYSNNFQVLLPDRGVEKIFKIQ